MAFRHGKKAAVTINAVVLTSYCDTAELSVDVETADTSTFGSDWKTALAGQAGGKFDIGGKYDPTAVSGPNVVISGLVGDDPFPVIYEPGGPAVGQLRRTFNAFLTSFVESSPVGGIVAWKASFQVDGAIVNAVISA